MWQTGVSAAGLGFGSRTRDGGGLLAVPTYDTATPAANVSYLVETATGGVVRAFALASPTFSQTGFADNLLLVTGGGQKAATLYAYG